MTEFAIISNGDIVNVIASRKPLSQMQDEYSRYVVKPLSETTTEQRKNYEYWSERP